MTLAMALVSMAFLMFHIFAQPFRVAWVNLLQTCANVCLVMLCVQQLVLSAFHTATFDPSADTEIQSFVWQVEGLAMVLCLPTPVFLAYGVLFIKSKEEEEEEGGNEDTASQAEARASYSEHGDNASPELMFVKDAQS